MLNDMISYTISFLQSIADFFLLEPICYLFGLICLCFVVKAFKMIIQF